MTKRFIYADNAATSPMSQAAIDTMVHYLATNYGNASQPYSFSRPAKQALKEARSIIADCIGANEDEIYFTSGGSESDNWTINNAYTLGLNIITTQIEHHAIINSCRYAEHNGAKLSYLPVSNYGLLNEEDLKNSLASNGLLSVMMANNEIGTIEPIGKYCTIAKEADVVFHTDAVQAIGHINVNVEQLGIDMLSASGHKFNGPKGVGFLYVRNGTQLSPFIHGGAQEKGMRAGTENIPAIMSMAVALRENVEHLESNQKHLHLLEEVLLDRIQKSYPTVTRNGTNHLPGLLSLSFENQDGEAMLHRLDLNGICVSTGSACDSKNTQISHVLKAINLPVEYAKGTIRISFGKFNTLADAEYIADSILNIII